MLGNRYITTPIYYVNDIPHIGHAYSSIIADCLKRFCKIKHPDSSLKVRLLTGTDEHGQKVEKSSMEKKIDTQKYCDTVSLKFQELSEFLNISNDDFIRTTEKRHRDVVIKVWNKLIDNGWIYKDKYKGWYSIRDEAFYSEKEIVDNKSPTGSEVSWHEEESYFFKLSKFQKLLLTIYEYNLIKIEPFYRTNEVTSFIKDGLNDLSISRTSFSWGIKVPNDEKHVIYVWIDALVNYISSLKYPDGNDYKEFWNDGIIHVIGKDILRFHAIYWPAILLGLQYNQKEINQLLDQKDKLNFARNFNQSIKTCKIKLPNEILVNGWWLNEGEKISKSLGNVINPIEEIEWIKESMIYNQNFTNEETEKIAIDYFRYFLITEISFGKDGSYSRESLKQRINSNLVNGLGNLIQRSLSMILKNYSGNLTDVNFSEEEDISLVDLQDWEKISNFKFLTKGKEIIIDYIKKANTYFDKSAPWKLIKEDKKIEAAIVILKTANYIKDISILLLPLIPFSSNKILEILKIAPENRNSKYLNKQISNIELKNLQIIFPKIDSK